MAFDNLSAQIQELESTVFAAEDDVFAAFCQQIGVSNIREYEERQMKVAQEESEARLRYDTQIARLTHQCVILGHSLDSAETDVLLGPHLNKIS